jgi:hypothetical protein
MVFDYPVPAGRRPREAIYRFDQRIAGTGIRYHAELRGTRAWPVFLIRVPVEHGATVGSIIGQL